MVGKKQYRISELSTIFNTFLHFNTNFIIILKYILCVRSIIIAIKIYGVDYLKFMTKCEIGHKNVNLYGSDNKVETN